MVGTEDGDSSIAMGWLWDGSGTENAMRCDAFPSRQGNPQKCHPHKCYLTPSRLRLYLVYLAYVVRTVVLITLAPLHPFSPPLAHRTPTRDPAAISACRTLLSPPTNSHIGDLPNEELPWLDEGRASKQPVSRAPLLLLIIALRVAEDGNTE